MRLQISLQNDPDFSIQILSAYEDDIPNGWRLYITVKMDPSLSTHAMDDYKQKDEAPQKEMSHWMYYCLLYRAVILNQGATEWLKSYLI